MTEGQQTKFAICATCRNPFGARRPRAIAYCSGRCRQQAHRDRLKIPRLEAQLAKLKAKRETP